MQKRCAASVVSAREALSHERSIDGADGLVRTQTGVKAGDVVADLVFVRAFAEVQRELSVRLESAGIVTCSYTYGYTQIYTYTCDTHETYDMHKYAHDAHTYTPTYMHACPEVAQRGGKHASTHSSGTAVSKGKCSPLLGSRLVDKDVNSPPNAKGAPGLGGARDITMSCCMCEPLRTAPSHGDDTHAVVTS